MTAAYTLKEKRDFAQKMRREPTQAESALWLMLQRGQLGARFQRQILVRGYIVDFYCATHHLAIEVDGSVHMLPNVYAADVVKEAAFAEAGITLFRFQNQAVIEAPKVVLLRIKTGLKALVPALSDDRPTVSSSSSRRKDNLAKLHSIKPVVAIGAFADCAKPVHEPLNSCELAGINAAFRKLVRFSRQKSLAFDVRPAAEKVTEQRYRLAEWLRKHPGSASALGATEAATLPLKGMDVTRRKA